MRPTETGQGAAVTRCKSTPPPREYGGYSVWWLAYTGDDQGHRGAMMPGVRPGWSWATTSDRTELHPPFLGGWGLPILPDIFPFCGSFVNRFYIEIRNFYIENDNF